MLVTLQEIIGMAEKGNYCIPAFNVYNIALLLSSYSLPLAVSKMVSARLAGKQYRNAARILRAALCYATIVGAFAAAVIWFGADFFAKDVFFMPYAAFALRTLAPTVWIMAYLGVFRGYFQGQGTMVPTAFSQVFEQIVNAIVSVAAGSFLLRKKGGNTQAVLASDTQVLEYADLESSISATGTVESSDTTKVYSTLAYQVKSVLVEVGDTVQEGDLLAELDAVPIENQIATHQTSMEVASGSAGAPKNLLAPGSCPSTAFFILIPIALMDAPLI